RARPAPSVPPRSLRYEEAAGDVADPAVGLDGVVAFVEVVDHADPARFGLEGVRVAEVPATAVVADDDLRPPAAALVLAHHRADAVGREPIAVDDDQPPVRHRDQAARRPEVVDARAELPGQAAV